MLSVPSGLLTSSSPPGSCFFSDLSQLQTVSRQQKKNIWVTGGRLSALWERESIKNVLDVSFYCRTLIVSAGYASVCRSDESNLIWRHMSGVLELRHKLWPMTRQQQPSDLIHRRFQSRVYWICCTDWNRVPASVVSEPLSRSVPLFLSRW